MAKFKIINIAGKEISAKDAVNMHEMAFPSGYDPLGYHDERSEHYVAECLFNLKQSAMIKDYKITGQLPIIPYKEGVRY